MVRLETKIKITGPNVHNVGYRVFLMKHAMNLALPGLSSYNWEENGRQEVIILVEGDEAGLQSSGKQLKRINRSLRKYPT